MPCDIPPRESSTLAGRVGVLGCSKVVGGDKSLYNPYSTPVCMSFAMVSHDVPLFLKPRLGAGQVDYIYIYRLGTAPTL